MVKGISRIEEVYKYLGLTQVEFSRQLGMSRRRIQDYMNGAEVGQKFIKAMEKKFPEINTAYIRYKSDVMLLPDLKNDQIFSFMDNIKFAEKDNLIEYLQEKLKLKDQEIVLLKKEIDYLKNRLNTN
jgi:transcriptional regulator with XRE-family HTH domain